MTSPNEPDQPGPGARPAAADGSTDLPPWQTGVRNQSESRSQTGNADQMDRAVQRTAEAMARATAASGGSVPASRYVGGVGVPDVSSLEARSATPPASAAERTEVVPAAAVEAYPSELPDLSGPLPKQAVQRQSSADLSRPPSPAPAPSTRTAPTSGFQVGSRPRGPVRASMQIRRIDPWSALKVSALLSGALFFVWMIAVAFLYLVLGAMGVWSKLNSNVGDLLTSGSGGGGDLVSAGSIFGGAALIGLVNIVLLTAMATIGAYIYNLSTDIVGGVEVTLADLD